MSTITSGSMYAVRTFDPRMLVIVGIIIAAAVVFVAFPDASIVGSTVTGGFTDFLMDVTGLTALTDDIADALAVPGTL